MPTPKTTDDIKAMLLRGEDVNLPGIGKLKVKTRNARTGRNPATGAAVDIPSRRAVVFSQSSVIAGELNGK